MSRRQQLWAEWARWSPPAELWMSLAILALGLLAYRLMDGLTP